MLEVVVGQAECVETHCAVSRVVAQCSARLAGRAPVAGIVLAGAGFDYPSMLVEIRQAFPGIQLVGCTAGGVMSSSFGFSQDCVALMLFASPDVCMAAGLGREAQRDPARAAREAVDMARARLGCEPALCLAFPDNLEAPAEEVVAELSAALGPQCAIFGGFAGGERMARAEVKQFFGDEALDNAVPLLLFGGPMQLASSISHSWRPVGMRAKVDASSGLDVLRLNGRPALEFYREALGPHAEPTVEIPLAVYEPEGGFSIRGAMGADRTTGAVRFSAHIPQGATVQLTEATPAGMVKDIGASLGKLTSGLPADFSPDAALVFSCDARRWILGLRAEEEIELLRAHLPPGLPIIGFHSFGEIGPLALGRPPRMHNCTMITVLLGSRRQDESAQGPPRLVELPMDPPQPHGLRTRLLERKLERARRYQERLEFQKELSAGLFRHMNAELREANRTIGEKNRLLRESLTLAQEVQQGLLPSRAPSVPGFDICGRSRYCDETGGDYFDYLPHPDADGRFSVVVGDVSGHGVAAALLMATARGFLRMRALTGGSPADLVSDLNRLLTSDVGDSGRFMTLFLLSLDLGTRELAWVRAGHEPAYLYDPATDTFTELVGEGMALGVLREATYCEQRHGGLAEGQLLVLSTDGIREARNRRGEFFGHGRLERSIRAAGLLDAEGVVDAVLGELDAFLDGAPQEDDVALVAVKVGGSPLPRCPTASPDVWHG